MGKLAIGINLEFVRHADKSFECGTIEQAGKSVDYLKELL
jgi:hypothetical protein